MAATCQQLWDDCVRFMRAEGLTDSAYRTWFKSITPLSYEGGVLVLRAQSQFFVDYIEENYIQLLSKALFRIFGAGVKLEYRVLIDSSTDRDMRRPSTHFDGMDTAPMQPTAPVATGFDSQLKPEYTFNTFVQGECNKLARTAGAAIARDPGRSTFNPLFIYGGPGIGKTHLINAIGNEAKRLHPDKRVLYVSANTFKLQYMDAGREKHTADFLNFYQTIDVLLIDDIQFLTAPGTQETFFHIFNYLHQSGKQIILTSDKSPLELKGLEERLLSRFKWGLAAEMLRPDFSLRKDILRSKAYRDGIELGDEIIDFIAENVKNNVRDLEGVLASLLAVSILTGTEPSLEQAEEVVSRIVEITPTAISHEEIANKVGALCNVTIADIVGPSRQKDIAHARQIAMYLSKRMTGKSLIEIGKYYGNRSHATVLHAISIIEEQLKFEPVLKRQIDKLENQLRH